MKVSGRTVQFGGPLILCDLGLADDREWFARHHGRNHRIRPPIGREVAALAGGPPRWKATIIVRQVEPGARIRLACWLPRRPLNSEQMAAELFSAAADGPMVEMIESGVGAGIL